MSTIDDQIRGALDADDRAFLEGLEHEPGMFRQLGDTFRGPMKGWIILINSAVFLLTILGVYAVWGFLNAQGVESMLRWAALGWAAWTVQIAGKQWLMDRMNMLNILREVKRVELRIAMLSGSGAKA